jgi:hypothetical protein
VDSSLDRRTRACESILAPSSDHAGKFTRHVNSRLTASCAFCLLHICKSEITGQDMLFQSISPQLEFSMRPTLARLLHNVHISNRCSEDGYAQARKPVLLKSTLTGIVVSYQISKNRRTSLLLQNVRLRNIMSAQSRHAPLSVNFLKSSK